MYSLMSMNEYVTHRYYQHTGFNRNPLLQGLAKIFNGPTKISGGGHVEHHAETYDDMTLKTDDPKWMSGAPAQVLNADAYRGTAFSWPVLGLMYVQQVLSGLIPFTLMGFSLKWILAVSAPAIMLHTIIWNTLHPDMHALPPVPVSAGPPSEPLKFLRGSSYFNWLHQNHQGHHVLGGTVNYNVCCPGMDHLVGTYVPQSEWEPKMKPKRQLRDEQAVLA
jgi:hypothetical protein